MKRKVYLTGEMAHKFGPSHVVDVKTVKDALKCIDVNRPGLKEYFLESHEKNVGFNIQVAGKEIEESGLLLSLNEGDITVTPVVAGSKSGKAKILTAIAIAVFFFIPGTQGFLLTGGAHTTTTLTTAGQIAAGLAVNLALTGIQQLLAPDPSVDADEVSNYLLDGAVQNVIEGDPVPVLYGELRVPGTPISFEMVNRSFRLNNVNMDEHNNLIIAGV